MFITYEAVSGFIRLHKEDDNFYEWACGVRGHGKVAILGPTLTAPPPLARKLIAKKLIELGFERVRWQRRGYPPRSVEFPLSRWSKA